MRNAGRESRKKLVLRTRAILQEKRLHGGEIHEEKSSEHTEVEGPTAARSQREGGDKDAVGLFTTKETTKENGRRRSREHDLITVMVTATAKKRIKHRQLREHRGGLASFLL